MSKESYNLYAKIFMESAISVLESELQISFRKRSINVKTGIRPGFPISAAIGFFSSAIRGQAVYAMSSDFALQVVKSMMPNKLPLEQKKLTNSAVGELANMISGHASIKLAGEDNVVHITPPIVFQSSSMIPDAIDFLDLPVIVLLMDSEIGSLEIDIALKGIQS